MSVAKKNRSKTVDNKNWHLIKMVAAKKIWAKQRKIKNAPYKNDCGQKNRSKTVEKNAPYKNESGQKNLNQTVYDKKKMCLKNDCCQKNRSKTIEKKCTL